MLLVFYLSIHVRLQALYKVKKCLERTQVLHKEYALHSGKSAQNLDIKGSGTNVSSRVGVDNLGKSSALHLSKERT